MTREIRLGISTCPNDTFAFHALLNRHVDWRGLTFQTELLDIQQLNAGLRGGQFDVAKASFHAAVRMTESTFVLPSGSALGFGVGPLLLAARDNSVPADASQTTLCPGEDTTATLLFRLFYPDTTSVRHTVFSDIMPALSQRRADFGVCIHEGRFTWQNVGLSMVEDLGTRWEHETGLPLPLGGLLARTELPPDVIARVQQVIQDSVQFALADPDAALPTMRRYAQEFSDEVLMKHVDLYVNDWTIDLGEIGRRALTELFHRAQDLGLTPKHAATLRVFES